MRVVAASDSALIRERLCDAARDVGLDCAITNVAGLPPASQDVDLALLAVGVDLAGAMTAIHGCAQRAPVIVACDEMNSVDLPSVLRAGAAGYVRFEHLVGDLNTIIQEWRESGKCNVAWGRVIVVTGAVPGVGVTTIATNLAFALATVRPKHVALVQLTDNDLTLNLDVQPNYPLAELAAGWCRLDAAILKQRMVDHPAGISVLAEQRGQSKTVAWPTAAVRQVVTLLRSRFDFVVVDVGHALDDARLETVGLADDVILVQRLDAPTVDMTQQYVVRLANRPLIGLVNRYGQEQQLDWHQVQEMMQLPIVEWVPDDAASVNHALNARRPVLQVAAEAPITRSFARLASRWTRATVAAPAEQNWLEVG